MQGVTGGWRGINSPCNAGRTPDQRPDWECTRTARPSIRLGEEQLKLKSTKTKAAEEDNIQINLLCKVLGFQLCNEDVLYACVVS